jgi:hypothetical protein
LAGVRQEEEARCVMRFVTFSDVEIASDCLRKLETGALNVHDAMFHIDEASNGLTPLHDINEKWKDDMELFWQIGIEPTLNHAVVKTFIEDYANGLRELREVHLPF